MIASGVVRLLLRVQRGRKCFAVPVVINGGNAQGFRNARLLSAWNVAKSLYPSVATMCDVLSTADILISSDTR